MTRIEFLTELDRRLEVLPREEADRHLAYYAEILADRAEDGMTDEEAVASLESLDTITNRILSMHYTTKKEKNRDRRTAVICVSLIIGLISLIVFLLVAVATTSYTTSTPVANAPSTEIETTPVECTTVSIPADGIRNIEVNWISESLSFYVWDENEITLEVLDDLPLTYSVEGDTLTVGPEAAMTDTGSTLIVTLPRALSERLLNELTISVTSAYVDLFEINASKLNLTTISGGCTVDGFFDEVNVFTTSGDVFVYGSFERGTFEAISGGLYITADGMMRSCRVDAVSGSVSLTLPQNLGYTLAFDSVSGNLYADELEITSSADFTHGDGTAEIVVDTVSGDLSLMTF